MAQRVTGINAVVYDIEVPQTIFIAIRASQIPLLHEVRVPHTSCNEIRVPCITTNAQRECLTLMLMRKGITNKKVLYY